MKNTRKFQSGLLQRCVFETLESRVLLAADTVSLWELDTPVNGASRVFQITKSSDPTIKTLVERTDITGDHIIESYQKNQKGAFRKSSQLRAEYSGGDLPDGWYAEKIWGENFVIILAPRLTAPSILTLGSSSIEDLHGGISIQGIDEFVVTGSTHLTVGAWTTITIGSTEFQALPVTTRYHIWGTTTTYTADEEQYASITIDSKVTTYFVKGIGEVKFSQQDSIEVTVNDETNNEEQTFIEGELTSMQGTPVTEQFVAPKSTQYKSGILTDPDTFRVNVTEVFRTINFNHEEFKVSAVLSKDKIWGNEDDVVIQANQNFMPASTGVKQKLTLSSQFDPKAIEAGLYYVGVRFDGGESLNSLNTSDNIWWSAKADVNVLNAMDLRAVNKDLLAAESTTGQQQDNATWRISRINNDSSAPQTVNFTTGGTATRGRDYLLQVGGQTITGNTLTIPAGAMFVDVVMNPIDDGLVEQTETITLSLKPNSRAYALDKSHREVTFFLADLAVPIVSVKATRNTAEQYDAQAKYYGAFTFTRVGGDISKETSVLVKLGGSAVSIDDYALMTAGGEIVTVNSDGTAVIKFAAGAKTTVISVVPGNDFLKEGTELVELAILPAAGEVAYRPDPKAANIHAVVKIADNDLAVDSLSGTQIIITATAKDDSTGAKFNRNGRMYMGDADCVEQLKNAIIHGTYSLTKTSGNTITLTTMDDGGAAFVYNLTFTSATAGRLTGTETFDGTTLTLSGSFSLAVSKVRVPPVITGAALALTVTASGLKESVGRRTTLSASANELTVKTGGVESIETYTYSVSANLGFLKRVDSESHTVW